MKNIKSILSVISIIMILSMISIIALYNILPHNEQESKEQGRQYVKAMFGEEMYQASLQQQIDNKSLSNFLNK